MIDKLRRDEGIGMITALAVTFVIFTLSGVWYGLAVHTSEQAAFGANRTQALAVAEAGVREATFQVLDTQGTYTGLGATSGVCNVADLTSQGQQLGTYWTNVTQIGALRDRTFLIQSWGWAPEPGASFTTPKYIEQQVRLVPSDFFKYGTFASNGEKDPNKNDNKAKLEKVEKLRVYGDAYFGFGAQLKDFRVFQNTGGYAGEGNLYGQGTLFIDRKKGVFIQGDTVVRYKIYDDGDNTEFNGDVYILENTGALPDPIEKPFKGWVDDAYFRNATVNGSIFLPAGATFKSGSTVNGGNPVSAGLPAAALPPTYDLPAYDPVGQGVTFDLTFNSVGAFDAWFKATANRNNLGTTGAVHTQTIRITDPGGTLNLDFKDSRLTGDLSIYAEVKEIRVKEGGELRPDVSNPPYQLSIVQYSNPAVEERGKMKLEGHSQFSDQMRVFLYTDGTVELKAKTVVYGAIYSTTIKSTGGPNSVYYRTIEPPLGLDTSAVEDVYAIQPDVWRELDPEVTKNFVTPATRYCTLPW